ncbi:uncharacterized protein BYT42DRAFT_615650 [Radiomyces spectabilis]|uniref:uncharacterized protein n=1 Tax=Radiomyces spectabilis TaxID=64574 RepID=UPI00221FDC47|nr:uncharacterized protein BYT42DRAFT_615650 [Radiomyces spectabilis]KAI8374491.1 hypothetical protein BYT42DRAFT_615650 [Radiomyces spectabilis]
MSKAADDIVRTEETRLQSEPILGGKKLDLLLLYKTVMDAGGFDQVTKSRSWKQVGDIFRFPATCTNSAYILKGLYIRNLLGWEEEKVWGKEWIVPDELRGPEAHKASTLAGKSYKKRSPKSSKSESFKQMPVIEASSTCSISERHHQIPPSAHDHSIQDRACLTAQQFNQDAKQRLLQGLQSSISEQVECAINEIVTISFECPEQLCLDREPTLLMTLLNIIEPSLQKRGYTGPPQTPSLNAWQNGDHDENSTDLERILKVLHILRNFSFIDINARILAHDARLKQILIKCLVLSSSSHYNHCIDVLENIARYIELGPFDAYIGCMASLVFANERHTLLGAVRVLTLLACNQENQPYLISGSTHVAPRIAQLLVVNDEEMIGAALEYLYQYTKISDTFRLQLLTMNAGADIAILVAFLMAKSKFFQPLILKDNQEFAPSPPQLSPSTGSVSPIHAHGTDPCLSHLGAYQQLDEPYRCLGWLKDKFESANPYSVLSLDDMYLLYEMRFGHEKALKMKDFYTVLKIAFPRASSSAHTPPYNAAGPVLEGASVRGIKIKMNILQDGSEILCQWTNCSQTFHDEILLQRHVLQDHIESSNNEAFGCMWTDCDNSFEDKDAIASHFHSHLDAYPHTSRSASVSSIDNVDTSDVQGIALVAAHLLRLLSKDPQSHIYFMPYERELTVIAEQKPKLRPYIRSMFSSFRVA